MASGPSPGIPVRALPKAAAGDDGMTIPPDPRASPFWPADNPAALGHITLLQGIITRLATASTSCKTWCLTLVGALLSLAGATRAPAIVTFALVPVVLFGFLDTMYLAQERAYRDLYKRIVGLMRTREYKLGNVFDAAATVTCGGIFAALFSWSVLPVYGGLIAAYLVAEHKGWLALLAAAPVSK
jgi:hypothetical protein